jgi:hypothetical protein
MDNDENEFWAELTGSPMTQTASSLDLHLRRREEEVASSGLRVLTDAGRAAAGLRLPVPPGMRVAFTANLGSVLAYEEPPAADATGTVIMVRTAEGDQTSLDDHVFVKFDDGRFLAMHREHLRRANAQAKLASNFALRVSSLGDLSGFLHRGGDDNDLVHKATKDLWSFQQTDDGDYMLARLFDDTGAPLRV